MIFETYKASGEYLSCGFNLDNAVQPRFYIQEYTGSYIFRKIFTRLSRDMSAWSHYCIKYDSTEGESTRLRVYVNGTEDTVTTTANLPSSNATSIISVGTQYIGYSENQSGHYLHAYLAEFVLVEGTDYAPTSFGEFDEDSPTIWKPKDVSGLTFGTNGFYLDFKDSGDLGDDESGNGNDFSETNLAATDQSSDSPTNNFCVINSLDNYYPGSTITENNLKVLTISGNAAYNPATFGLTAGKWYWEVKATACGDAQERNIIGISNQSPADAGYDGSIQIGDGFGLRGNGKMWDGSSETSGWNSFDADDIISVAVDFDNGKFYTATNGTYGNSSDPAAGSNGYSFTVGTAAWFPGVNCRETSQTGTFELNFGSPSFSISSGNADANGYGNFEYAVPSGYLAVCTKNLGSDGG
jgi:hypothetical protein